jgi:DNA-directed RNA polymerase specialized sigma24 family protein
MRPAKISVVEPSQNLPQLYRFCYLLTGDAGKAQEAFQATVREAALAAARGEPPQDRLWFFRDARWRCLELGEQGLQAEAMTLDECEVAPHAAKQVAQLDAEHLAIWISAAPDPQRTALAAFYLDEFTPRELMALLEMKAGELSDLICSGRRQFQAWLDATTPHYDDE